ncbi:MAG: hypothetical protein H7Y43_11540 [Akkermansiaceae bacterium]|nr:hypothetical protein [Verrucomicrobiales bacterium]
MNRARQKSVINALDRKPGARPAEFQIDGDTVQRKTAAREGDFAQAGRSLPGIRLDGKRV